MTAETGLLTEDQIRADERRKCAQELREHAKTLLQDAIALVTEGNEADGLPRVSRAAAIDSAANLLEPKEMKS